MDEPLLLDLSYEELCARISSWGEPSYRARQIWHAVYRDLVTEIEQITTLPAKLRQSVAQRLPLGLPVPEVMQRSGDGRTEKTLLRLRDNQRIETVAMRYRDRRTVCVSTQVGCAMGCSICATGRSGLARNLSSGEMVGQVLHVARSLRAKEERLTNVVYMGMGEPLLNYDATLASIVRLHDPHGFDMGARSFTVSTVGIVPGIERLSDEPLQPQLAVSLHAADDTLRSRLLPINRRYPLDRLLAACRSYVARTRRRVTFEVALIDGVNDRPADAQRLADRLVGWRCHVNLIPFNPVHGVPWAPSPPPQVERYAKILEAAGVPATVRVRRGVEIEAGCGQLRGRPHDA